MRLLNFLSGIEQFVSKEVKIKPFPAKELINKKQQPLFIPQYKPEDIIPSDLQRKYGITLGDHMVIHAVLKILFAIIGKMTAL
jgi:hypothetical protein